LLAWNQFVSDVENIKINVATDEYQIVEWDLPRIGVASGYRVAIYQNEDRLIESRIDADDNHPPQRHYRALLHRRLIVGTDYALIISAIDNRNFATPSNRLIFRPRPNCKYIY
jgi:hypothetical protein